VKRTFRKHRSTKQPAFNNFSGVGRFGMGTLKVDGNAADTKAMERNCSRDFAAA
jgi:hypothetical protein